MDGGLADWVRQLKPNVVVLLAGGGEVLDREFEGHMADILHPVFAAYVKSQLSKAVRIATAGGALMVLMTKPCQSTGEQLDGEPSAQDDSSARQGVYNSLLRQVAAEHPNQVYVQDLIPTSAPVASTPRTERRAGAGVGRNPLPVPEDSGVGGDYLAPAILPYWLESATSRRHRRMGPASRSVPSRSSSLRSDRIRPCRRTRNS